MSINKSIKKKESLFSTFINETNTGENLCIAAVLIGGALGVAVGVPAVGKLIKLVLSPLVGKQIWLLSNYEKYPVLADILDSYIIGMIGTFIIIVAIYLIFSFLYACFNFAKDIQLAKIKQLLPVDKEEWKEIGIKTKEDIFDNLKSIYLENKRLDLYEDEEHELKYSSKLFDSIASGYEVLWENAKKSFISGNIHSQEELNKIKTIYITFKILASEDLPCYLKTKCADYMKGDATYLKYDDYIKNEPVNSCPNYSKLFYSRLHSDEQLAEKFEKFMEKVEEEFDELFK